MTYTHRRVGLPIDPTVPVHRQPTFVVRPGGGVVTLGCAALDAHQWFAYANGVECPAGPGRSGCGRLLVRLDGRRWYRGRHRGDRRAKIRHLRWENGTQFHRLDLPAKVG